MENLKYMMQNRPSLLIIDEISMVSNVMLMKIHARLVEILGESRLSIVILIFMFILINIAFGGMNILSFGDFLQLPPVSPIYNHIYAYKRVTPNAFLKYFKSNLPAINLWNVFKYKYLQMKK